MPVGDMDRTVATPSSGFPITASVKPGGPAAGTSRGALDTPIGSTAPRPAAGGAADFHLRSEGGPAAHGTEREEGRGYSLRVFLAAVVLVAVAGGLWILAQQRRPAVPAAPAPAPLPAASTSEAPATATAPPDTAPAAPAPAAPPASASTSPRESEPAAPTAAAGPPAAAKVREAATTATVTFKSNIYAELSINGKRHPASLPAPARVTLKPGRYSAVFDAPGFMKITKELEISAADPRPLTVVAEFPGRGIVTVTVLPAGAEVRIDGVSIGVSTGGTMKKTLRAGPHEISARLAGHETFSKTVNVEEDDSISLPRIVLKKE
jgi:hypothetical protein